MKPRYPIEDDYWGLGAWTDKDKEELGEPSQQPYDFIPDSFNRKGLTCETPSLTEQEEHAEDQRWRRRILLVIVCVALAMGLLAYVTRQGKMAARNVERNTRQVMPVRMRP